MKKKHNKKRKNKQIDISGNVPLTQEETQIDQPQVQIEESKENATKMKQSENEVMFHLNQLYHKDDDQQDESSKKLDQSSQVPLISQNSCQNITDQFRALQQEINHNQIIKSPDFILDHTMQSYQLFHPKTDFSMNIPKSFNLQDQFTSGNLKPAEELQLDQMILMIDELFNRETLFYRGYEPMQTINLCALKIKQKYHKNCAVINAIIHAESYQIFKLIEVVRNCFCQREDDFHAPILHQKFTSKSSTQIVKLFLDAEKEIDNWPKTQSPTHDENCKQLKTRLKFLRGFFQFIDRITEPREFCQKFESSKINKQLDEKYNFIVKNCLLIQQHCNPEKAKRDQSKLNFIKSYFQKKTVVNFPGFIQPKHVPDDQSKFAYTKFRQLVLKNLRRAIQLPIRFQQPGSECHMSQDNEKKFSVIDFQKELLSLNMESNYNLLVRCVTEHILFPLQIDYKRNKLDPDMKLKSLKSDFANQLLYFKSNPKCTNLFNVQDFKISNIYSKLITNIFPKMMPSKKGGKAGKKQAPIEFSQTQHGKQFLTHFQLLVKAQILRNLRSKSRQHRNCSDFFRDITIIINQGNIADQIHQKLLGSSINCPATSLVINVAIRAMIRHLHSMMDLDILQFRQIKQVFRYIACTYQVGANNNKLMMMNSLNYSHSSNNPMDTLNFLLQNEAILAVKSSQTRYYAYEQVMFSALMIAMNGISLLMELINRFALKKKVKGVRYPDPWKQTYSNFDGSDAEQSKGNQSLVSKMREAAYNERFKVFKQLPFPKFISYQQNEAWFDKFKDDDDLLVKQGKECLMKAGQVFTKMKKFKNRNPEQMSDQLLDSSSRRCVLNSLNLVKLYNLKEGEQIELKFQLERQIIPLLNIQKLQSITQNN